MLMCISCVWFLMRLRQPRSTRTSTLFPSTALCRSAAPGRAVQRGTAGGHAGRRPRGVVLDQHLDAANGRPAGGGGLLSTMELAQPGSGRSEEHTSELQSLMRISYAVFCLTKTTTI